MTTGRAALTGAFPALADLLVEMARVIAQLTRDEYAESGVAHLSGSIGGHVRHCLDHVLALERALESGEVDYDRRRRHTAVERDRELAVLSLQSAARRLERVRDAVLDQPVVARALITPDGRAVSGASSVARELAFVINHTIHHNAQIALLADRVGARGLPGRFGIAPATPVLAGVA